MLLLILGIALLVLKYTGWEPLADSPWWHTLVPFGLAILWWTWADLFGYTKKVQFEKQEERRLKRLDKLRKALGMAVYNQTQRDQKVRDKQKEGGK